MSRAVESVIAEAVATLETSGQLDMDSFVDKYPEHADELRELLPVIVSVHQDRRWRMGLARVRANVFTLFEEDAAAQKEHRDHKEHEDLTEHKEHTETLGSLFRRDLEESGRSVEEQVSHTGIEESALKMLLADSTPLSDLGKSEVKEIADNVKIPFGLLYKQLKRMIGLDKLVAQPAASVFTRSKETSTSEDHAHLVEKVIRRTRPKAPSNGRDPSGQ